MPYIVYETMNRRIAQVFRTLSEANTLAGGNPALSVSPERTITQVDDAEPGLFVTTAWAIVTEILDDDTVNLRNAFWNCHHQLVSWREQLLAAAHGGEPWEAVGKGTTFLYWQQVALYHISQSPNYTVAQKIAWANEVGKGALDITNPTQFFQRQASLTAPSGPNTWVNPNNAQRVNLGTSLTLSGPGSGNINIAVQGVPAGIHIGGGQWIDSLTA